VTMKKKVLTHLAGHAGKHTTLKELSRTIGVKSKSDYRELRMLLQQLVQTGVLRSDQKGRFSYGRKKGDSGKGRPSTGRMVGRLQVLRNGTGIVKADPGGEEIAIPAKFLTTALHGDTVAVVLFARPLPAREGKTTIPEGEIVEIVERGILTVTGRLERSRHFFVVIPDNDRITRDIYVSAEEAEKAQPGDKVVVELLPWTDEHLNPEGTIVEVLGPSGDARVEVKSVARSFGLPLTFPREVLREADECRTEITADDLRGRLDMRSITCVTIDPDDAKDYDDAVSLERLDADRWRLGVHIADVSHYVREGSALDREALARGTSVYMVNEVVPMLPERLSNNLCSLLPHADRLTVSAMMDVNRHGTVESAVIRKSVIRSAQRFTYEEVQGIIEAGAGEHADLLLPLHKLTRMLTQRRRRNGSLDLDTSEAKFTFDANGLPERIIKKQRLDAHRLVEECMLLANKTVAKHGAGMTDRPFIYRVHDVPDPSRVEDLARFVKQFGFSLAPSGGVTGRALQKLLDDVRGSEVENLINEVVLRSMAKAVYATKNIGHYGLAFRHYTHFTSPIRRYPDLMIHRLLQEYGGPVSPQRTAELRDGLAEIAGKSSERERVAMQAERASVKVMQVEYMKRHLGDVFDGVIGGVTSFGLFVEIDDLLVEGLVRVRDMEDDYYLFDEKQYALRGRSKGKTYRLGDRVNVRVMLIDPVEGQMNFALVGDAGRRVVHRGR